MKNKKAFLKEYSVQQARIKRLEEMILTHPAKEEHYTAQINECISICNNIESRISQLNDTILEEILIQKYICRKTLSEVSASICYSKRQTERLHAKALNLLEVDS
jgi:hypothetical protein